MAKGYVRTPVGILLVEASDEGVVALNWAKGEGKTDKHPVVAQAIQELNAYFSGKLKSFEVPLDVDGTAFQCKVWAAMGEVPFGKTVTYGELAKKLKTSARAVGGACGTNPVPVIVPCHRIVGANKELTGYSGAGGVKTKQALLKLEQVK